MAPTCEKYCTPQPPSPDHSSTGRVGAVVHRHEGQFVEPAGDVARVIHVAGRLAGAHRDAQHRVFAERHGAGQRRHFAVVHDLQRHAQFLADAQEHAGDLLVEVLLRHAAEERGHAHAVVDVDAGGAAADGVQARQLRGGAADGVQDALVVVVRIALVARVPDHLLAEDGFAVDHGAGLAVAGAQVEADAAAVQVAPERHGGFLLRPAPCRLRSTTTVNGCS